MNLFLLLLTNPLFLFYDKPAANWNEALPIGNGRMGAMIFGGVTSERLQLNEQTLWSGAPRNWNNPAAKNYLPLVRAAVAENQYRKADSLSRFMQGPYTESYMPMADLWLDYPGISAAENYSRSLSLDSAIHRVQFRSNGVRYLRQTFASYPGKVIVHRETTDKPGMLNLDISISSKLRYTVKQLPDGRLLLSGKCPRHVEPAYLWQIKEADAVQYDPDPNGEGMNFSVILSVQRDGGDITVSNNRISVSKANSVIITIAAATSYNGFQHSPGLNGIDPFTKATGDLAAANLQSYQKLLSGHLKDYQDLFHRYQLDLGKPANIDLPTDQRLKAMKSTTDPQLVALIAQYGRYLLISGSRRGGQPVNLKGIWNEKLRPEYSSNWCIDHDAQMFYYAAETTNLPDVHEPFLQFIEDLSVNGAITAKTNYGMRGWVAHHNTDLWRQSSPVGNYGEGNPHWATWNMSAAWLCAHLFEHYLFTGDRQFLQKRAWPVMREAARFCLDWLKTDKNGQLVSSPSVSPENTFITKEGDTAQISSNSSSDIALMKELFSNCINTIEILKGTDTNQTSLLQRLKDAVSRLPAYKTGAAGNLLEWEQDWEPVDPSHRHLSHMYPVFPGNEISPLRTPVLALAAKKALSKRTKTNSTWGFSWKAACWARLGEPDSAWNTLNNQLQFVGSATRTPADYGLFPNLFNSEGSSTIMNGNGCITAVIAEMLVQSAPGKILLLPALPTVFSEGSAKGICTRGGFVVDIQWKNGKVTKARILSRLGGRLELWSAGQKKIYQSHPGQTISI